MPRKKQFEVAAVLARAGSTFSKNGYHATSVGDLELATRIMRSSLYDTFGSKRGLFLSALRRHLEVEGNARQWIVEQAPALAIMALAERVAGDEFTVRTAVELASHDDEIGRIVAGVQREVAHLFGALIGQGQCGGEIDGAVDPDRAGSAVVGLCIGAGVIGAPLVALQQQVRTLLRMPSGE